MKNFRASVGVFLAAASLGLAQQPALNEVDTAPAAAAPLVMRTPQEVDQLVGPIALYPDALIALILPASTVPADVVLAARYVRDFPNDRSQIEHRAWDESVKSLTNYPEVLQWMDQNLQWTKQLGEAFAAQPADVMQSVQRLRAKARAAGTLVDTPQQQVIAEPQVIRIVPAQPDVIYVPRYEPEVVFVDRPVYYPEPFLTFGIGMPVGSWLAFDFDWYRHTIWMGNRHRPWSRHDWRRPLVPIAPPSAVVVRTPPTVRQWRPPPQPPRPLFSAAYSQRVDVVRPTPFGAPAVRTYGPRTANNYSGQRRPEPNPLPVVNPLPQTFAPASTATQYAGPRVVSPALQAPVQPTNPNFRAQAPAPTPATTVSPAPSLVNRPASNRGWVRERESRVYVQQPASANAAALPSVPSMPMAMPSYPATVVPAAPGGGRVYSHQVPSVPALPMASAARSAPVGPVVAAPAPAQAAPAAQPAQPAQRTDQNGNDRRRGRNEN